MRNKKQYFVDLVQERISKVADREGHRPIYRAYLTSAEIGTGVFRAADVAEFIAYNIGQGTGFEDGFDYLESKPWTDALSGDTIRRHLKIYRYEERTDRKIGYELFDLTAEEHRAIQKDLIQAGVLSTNN